MREKFNGNDKEGFSKFARTRVASRLSSADKPLRFDYSGPYDVSRRLSFFFFISSRDGLSRLFISYVAGIISRSRANNKTAPLPVAKAQSYRRVSRHSAPTRVREIWCEKRGREAPMEMAHRKLSSSRFFLSRSTGIATVAGDVSPWHLVSYDGF